MHFLHYGCHKWMVLYVIPWYIKMHHFIFAISLSNFLCQDNYWRTYISINLDQNNNFYCVSLLDNVTLYVAFVCICVAAVMPFYLSGCHAMYWFMSYHILYYFLWQIEWMIKWMNESHQSLLIGIYIMPHHEMQQTYTCHNQRQLRYVKLGSHCVRHCTSTHARGRTAYMPYAVRPRAACCVRLRTTRRSVCERCRRNKRARLQRRRTSPYYRLEHVNKYHVKYENCVWINNVCRRRLSMWKSACHAC